MLTVLMHELKYYFTNKQECIHLYSYFISIILLLPFANQANISEIQHLASITLWIALTSAIALGAASLFKRDYDQGQLECYQLLPISIEAVVFSKWLAFLGFVLAPLLATLPVAGLLFNLSSNEIIHYTIGLSAGAAALSIIATGISAITSSMGKVSAIMSLVIFPLTIPVIIFGSHYCQNTSMLWQPNLLFLIGFSCFLLPIMCLAGAYSIRASN